MKIGWAKLSMSIELDFNTASASSSQERCPVIRNLIKKGHKVIIYTPLMKSDELLLKEMESGGCRVGEWDNSHLREVEYDPKGFPIDCDVLVIESGALNFMYGDKYSGEPQIRRVAKLLDKFKGLVIYMQYDPILPFPFAKLAGRKKDWLYEENPYRLGDTSQVPNLEDYGWGTRDELFKDKKWVVLFRTPDVISAAESYNGSRYGIKDFYDDKDIDLSYLPSPRTNEYLSKFNVKENPKYDIFYPGYPKGREKRFEKLILYYVKYYNIGVSGLWDRSKNYDCKLTYEDLGLDCVGFVNGLANLYDYINNSCCVVHIEVGKGRKLGWQTTRHIEAIFCKSIAFYDDSMKFYDQYVDFRFGVNEDNVYEKYKWLFSLSYAERQKLWAYQYNKVKHLTIDWYVNELLKICEHNNIDINKADGNLIELYNHVYDEKEVQCDVEYADNEIENIFDKMNHVSNKVSKRDIKYIKKIRMEKEKQMAEEQEKANAQVEEIKPAEIVEQKFSTESMLQSIEIKSDNIVEERIKLIDERMKLIDERMKLINDKLNLILSKNI